MVDWTNDRFRPCLVYYSTCTPCSLDRLVWRIGTEQEALSKKTGEGPSWMGSHRAAIMLITDQCWQNVCSLLVASCWVLFCKACKWLYVCRRFCFDCCSDGPAADYDDVDDNVLASLPGSTWYEVVYPVQIRGSEEMQGLDTRDHRGRHKVGSLV